MNSTMMMNPTAMPMGAMTGMMPGMPMMPGMMSGMSGMPMGNMSMVVRCTMKMEKCAGGMKMTCICEDEVSAATLQNMCEMMAGGMCSCCCMMNGMTMCMCNMAMATCKCTKSKNGVTITCTSGDESMCEMIQACCDCMTMCLKDGCMCCVCMNGMPMCCGTAA